MNLALTLARPEIRELRPYESARSLAAQGKILLDANESPLPLFLKEGLNRYPEPQPRLLLERFAMLYQVPSSMLLLSRGSDEAIDLLIRVFCEPGKDQILICPPTYGMYEIGARIQGAGIVKIPLSNHAGQFTLNESEIFRILEQKNSIKIIFLCSPNNPTGTGFEESILTRICQATEGKCIVAIDEAYAEFNPRRSMIQALPLFSHLVVLRTLSKAWALAGARCGAAIAQNDLICVLNCIRPPYPLSTPSVKAVLEATDIHHQKILEQQVKKSQIIRENLKISLLKLISVQHVYSSDTNFLLVKFRHSQAIFEALKLRGIILRDRSFEPGLENCLRITIGTEEEMELLLSALQEIK